MTRLRQGVPLVQDGARWRRWSRHPAAAPCYLVRSLETRRNQRYLRTPRNGCEYSPSAVGIFALEGLTAHLPESQRRQDLRRQRTGKRAAADFGHPTSRVAPLLRNVAGFAKRPWARSIAAKARNRQLSTVVVRSHRRPWGGQWGGGASGPCRAVYGVGVAGRLPYRGRLVSFVSRPKGALESSSPWSPAAPS